MQANKRSLLTGQWMIVLALVLMSGTANARDREYRVIYEFGHGSSDGWLPGGLAVDVNGDLYGITEYGGANSYGTVFKLTAPQTRGGAWTRSVLYNFPGGKGGGYPGLLVLGEDGNLYGVDFDQTVFELKRPTFEGRAWNYTLLCTLSQTEGSVIQGLIFDAKGNLYGATELGGDLSCEQEGCGTVFELKRPSRKGGRWRLNVLYTFGQNGDDGVEPFAGVTFDQRGNLYGTTNYGGTYGFGTVYQLRPPLRKGQVWTEIVLYSFDRSSNIGSSPEGPVIFDFSGNVYGTTAFGGDLNCQGGFGCGVVFELSPPAGEARDWTYTTLYAFEGGDDGIQPSGYMVLDNAGRLHGTTQAGGAGLNGTVFRLSSPKVGRGTTWTEMILHAFTGTNGDGSEPADGLIWGKWGDLYGATPYGGSCGGLGCGTAFEVRP